MMEVKNNRTGKIFGSVEDALKCAEKDDLLIVTTCIHAEIKYTKKCGDAGDVIRKANE